MPQLIEHSTLIPAVGSQPKQIHEYFGLASTGDGACSIARMVSSAGWVEPGQTPQFDEYTLVLKGRLVVEWREGRFEVRAGQAIRVFKGEWVRYSTPEPEGAEYIAICLPAFSPHTVHRDPA